MLKAIGGIAARTIALAGIGLAAVSVCARGADAAVKPKVEVVVTSGDMHYKLARLPDASFGAVPAPGATVIHVNERVRYQRIKGVGAAMTDSSAWLIRTELSPAARASLMNALFGAAGIHLGFIRVPIGASDFTAGRIPYSYDDLPSGMSDPGLAHFSLAHDNRWVIPALRQALAYNPGAFVLATPWSVPGWMKANGRLDNIAHSGWLKPSAYLPLANYFVKFLKGYAARGIRVDAITPQNEPGTATHYPGMDLNASSEGNFIARYLEPALFFSGLSTMIYGYDAGWSAHGQAYPRRLERSVAAPSLTGIATHCYFGSPTVMSDLHAINPRLDEIVSECSPGLKPFSTSELLIASMRNWASAVALWNLALDPAGQPVQPPNSGCPNCSGVVTVDEAAHSYTPTLDYYQLGQVSRFVRPGAVRIGSQNFVAYRYPPWNFASHGLDDVAFLNPDGSKVLVVYNSASTDTQFSFTSDRRALTALIAPRMTETFVWDRPSPARKSP